jgi:hypothetical protein
MTRVVRWRKRSTYVVTVTREVTQTLTFTVEAARSAKEAEDIAAANASVFDANQLAHSVTCQVTKAKAVRR